MSSHQQRVRFLYKTILRLHRGLPPEARELGDTYVKDEFRRHKSVDKQHIGPFMNEWATYCLSLAKQLGVKGPKTGKKLGEDLSVEQLDDFGGEQIYQLYELRQSIAPIPDDISKLENKK